MHTLEGCEECKSLQRRPLSRKYCQDSLTPFRRVNFFYLRTGERNCDARGESRAAFCKSDIGRQQEQNMSEMTKVGAALIKTMFETLAPRAGQGGCRYSGACGGRLHPPRKDNPQETGPDTGSVGGGIGHQPGYKKWEQGRRQPSGAGAASYHASPRPRQMRRRSANEPVIPHQGRAPDGPQLTSPTSRATSSTPSWPPPATTSRSCAAG